MLVEDRAFHAAIIILELGLVQNVALDGDGSSSINVVAGNHTHDDTSILNIGDGLWNLITYSVFDAQDGNESESTFLDWLDLGISGFVVAGSILIFLDVFVSDGYGSKGIFSVRFNVSVHGLEDGIVTDLSHTVGI